MSGLPKGWARSAIEDISERVVVGFVGSSKKHYGKKGVPFLTGKNIKNLGLDLTYYDYISFEFHNKEKKSQLKENDVVVVRIGRSGESAVIPKNLGEANCGGLVIIKQPKIYPPFLSYYLNSPQGIESSVAEAGGMTRQTLNTQKIAEKIVPIAPLNEQMRIAAKLDQLLTAVDACKTRLDKIPAIIKRFRQSVLAAATSGDLTEDWRVDNNPNKFESEGKEELFEIPESWSWFSIENVADVKGGKRLPKGEKLVQHNTGYPYIKAGQLKNGTVQPEGQEYLTAAVQKKIQRYIVDAGDIYITIVGACIGDAGIIPESYDKANLTENAAKLCNMRNIDNQYLAFWLRSPHVQDYIKFLVKSGAQGKLALMRIKEIPIPLMDIQEQKEIVRRVEALFAVADQLEEKLQIARTRVDKLTPSILAKAFRGKLVPQDPNDEPAEKLLEHIRQTRELERLVPKQRRKKTMPKKTKSRKSATPMGVIEALQEHGGSLPGSELFNAAGYAPDSDSDTVEKFLVSVREALELNQVKRERQGDEDWFSIAS